MAGSSVRATGSTSTSPARGSPPSSSSSGCGRTRSPASATVRSPRMRRLLVTIACLAVLGCGSGEKPTAEAPEPTASTRAQPHITSPTNGDVIPATAELGDTRGAKITVKGTAEPTTKVIVGSGCPQAVCTQTTVSDTDGSFRAAVSASTTEANHAVTLTVAYDVTDQVDSDRIIVTLGKEQDGGGGDALPTA